MSADVQLLGTLSGQQSGSFAGVQALGQNVEKAEGQPFRSQNLVELLNHCGVVGLRGGVNGNHTRGIAHAQHELACYLPVNIACQCGQELDVLDVLVAVQNALVQV